MPSHVLSGQMNYNVAMRHFALLILAAAALAGCSLSERVENKVAPDMVSLADRCGLIMKAAMPFAAIDLGDRTSRSPDVRTIITTVTGTRTDVPKDVSGGRNLAAECTFVDNVLSAFRWTKGGPPPPVGSAPPGEETLPPAPPGGSTRPGTPPTHQTPPAGKTQLFH